MWTALTVAIGLRIFCQAAPDEASQRLQDAVQAANRWRTLRPAEGPSTQDLRNLEDQMLNPPPPPPTPWLPGFAPPGYFQPYPQPPVRQDPVMDPYVRRWLEGEAIRWAQLRRQALRGRLAPWEGMRDVDLPWPSTAAIPPMDPPWRNEMMPPWLPLHQPLTVQYSSDDSYLAWRRMDQAIVRGGMQAITDGRAAASAEGDAEAGPAFEERWADVLTGVRGTLRR